MAQFQNLTVWKRAHELVLDIYHITKKFPSSERYRLIDQLCRSVSSIPANICEGSGRSTDKDFAHFLTLSRGSLYETKYHLILAKDLGYIDSNEFEALFLKCDTVGKLINSLIKRLKQG